VQLHFALPFVLFVRNGQNAPVGFQIKMFDGEVDDLGVGVEAPFVKSGGSFVQRASLEGNGVF